MRIFWLKVYSALIFLAFFLLTVEAHVKTKKYYESLQLILEGKDPYKILKISPTATQSELKKQYHALSLKFHPDKNPSANATTKYIEIAQAYEILSDRTYRKEYDELVKNGIPWQEQYYGRYMHKWGAPQHDVRWVAFWLLTFVTGFKYLYQYYHYVVQTNRAKQTPLYKMHANMMRDQLGRKKKKNGKKSNNSEDTSEEEVGPQIVIHGAEPPKFRDLLIFQICALPYHLVLWVKNLISPTHVDYDKILCEQNNWTMEELEIKKKEYMEKYLERKTSAKMKRYRRWLKKQ
eukprot:TRINITY_DN7978_c0_g1_i1.p1 TRINITY_DN7978_c0_g1~~TRINITY_DN7978_c0_g1_i1.p1  ORF type:complete len:291 (-),score=47.39 TRINITY_DN7978_c0_g1_i1:16-888(-)